MKHGSLDLNNEIGSFTALTITRAVACTQGAQHTRMQYAITVTLLIPLATAAQIVVEQGGQIVLNGNGAGDSSCSTGCVSQAEHDALKSRVAALEALTQDMYNKPSPSPPTLYTSCAAAATDGAVPAGTATLVGLDTGGQVMCDDTGFMKLLHFNPSQEDDDQGTIGNDDNFLEQKLTTGTPDDLTATYVPAEFYTATFGESYLIDSAHGTKVMSTVSPVTQTVGEAIDGGTSVNLWIPDCTSGCSSGLRTGFTLSSSSTSDGRFASGENRLELHVTPVSGYCEPCIDAISTPCTVLYNDGRDEGFFILDSNQGMGGCRRYGKALSFAAGVDTRYELWVK